jgi:hypothetical protein
LTIALHDLSCLLQAAVVHMTPCRSLLPAVHPSRGTPPLPPSQAEGSAAGAHGRRLRAAQRRGGSPARAARRTGEKPLWARSVQDREPKASQPPRDASSAGGRGAQRLAGAAAARQRRCPRPCHARTSARRPSRACRLQRNHRRTSQIRLNGVSAAFRKCVNPALRNTSASRRGPACAPKTSPPPSDIACAQQITVDAP